MNEHREHPPSTASTRGDGRLPVALLVAVLYALVTVAFTWPMAMAPRSVLLGHPGNDTWNHVWGFWWVAQEILAFWSGI